MLPTLLLKLKFLPAVGELDIRKKYNINIMAVKSNGKINMSVSTNTLFTNNITLLVLGEYKAIQKCFHI